MSAADEELGRLHSWAGLLELLDEHWPEDVFPTEADSETRDAGPRIVSLLRWVERLRAEVDRLLKFTATCTCGTSVANYEGPQPDCMVHGAVRAFNEERAENERLRAELAEEQSVAVSLRAERDALKDRVEELEAKLILRALDALDAPGGES